MFWKPIYKVWWNDKEAIKSQNKYGNFLLIISALFYYIVLFDKVTIKEYIALSLILSLWLYVIIEYIYKLPNGFIDEKKQSKGTQSMIRFVLLFMSTFMFYLITVGILQNYYSFFEQLVCCDLVKKFNLDIK